MLKRNRIRRQLGLLVAALAVFGVQPYATAQSPRPGPGAGVGSGAVDAVQGTGRIYRDWQEACEPERRGAKVCFIYQQVRHNGRPAANVTIGYKARSKRPVAVINMPLGAILLPDGLRIETDKGVDGWAPFLFCDVRGCHVETELAPDLLAAMQAGAAAWVVVRDLRGQQLRLPFSLLGLTAGLDALRRQGG